MKQWKIVFHINGRRFETIISANSHMDARRLLEAQYSGSKVVIFSVTQV